MEYYKNNIIIIRFIKFSKDIYKSKL